MLIAAIPYDLEKIQGAFRWAADVRDTLAEPQTADLYMFMLIDGVASEDAARLETDDRFCRKVVVREGKALTPSSTVVSLRPYRPLAPQTASTIRC